MSKFKSKAKLDFLSEKPIDKVTVGKQVITGVGGQTTKLKDLPYTTAQMSDANADLEKKTLAAMGGDKTAIEQRNASEKAWKNIFKAVANYVSYVADGDTVLIAQCGFQPSAEESKPQQETVALEHFEGSPIVKSPGALELTCATQGNAKGYVKIVAPPTVGVEQQGNVLILTVNGEKVFLTVDTHSKTVMHGLPSGTELGLYGAAFNSLGVGQLTQAKNVKAL